MAAERAMRLALPSTSVAKVRVQAVECAALGVVAHMGWGLRRRRFAGLGGPRQHLFLHGAGAGVERTGSRGASASSSHRLTVQSSDSTAAMRAAYCARIQSILKRLPTSTVTGKSSATGAAGDPGVELLFGHVLCQLLDAGQPQFMLQIVRGSLGHGWGWWLGGLAVDRGTKKAPIVGGCGRLSTKAKSEVGNGGIRLSQRPHFKHRQRPCCDLSGARIATLDFPWNNQGDLCRLCWP